jgi:adenosine kinase
MRQVPGLTTYVGSVGTDKYGELLEAQAAKDGVRVLYQKTGEHPTGTCAALIHQRER